MKQLSVVLLSIFVVVEALVVGCSSSSDDDNNDAPDGSLVTPPTTPPPQDGSLADVAADDAGNTGTDAGDAEPTGIPGVRFLGRFDMRDDAGAKVQWAGARAIYRFNGTGLTVKLSEQDDSDLPNGDPDPSRYDVLIDGNVQATPLTLTKGAPKDYVVASNLAAATPHVVELWRRTETFVGTTQFHGYTVTAGQILAPPAPAAHRIEIVGDSASNGYGIECPNASGEFSGATQNERKSYAALMAKALNADHFNLSFAGKGVYRNYDHGDMDMYSSIYLRTLADDDQSTWTFGGGAWTPDLVWIALGGNDFDIGSPAAGAPNLTTFKAKYHDLVTLLRAKNPSAIIVCTIPASLNDDYPPGYKAFTNMVKVVKEVVDERKAQPFNDAKVHYYELPRADSSGNNGAPDLTGCEGHANAAFHQKIAADAVTKIKAITGW